MANTRPRSHGAAPVGSAITNAVAAKGVQHASGDHAPDQKSGGAAGGQPVLDAKNQEDAGDGKL